MTNNSTGVFINAAAEEHILDDFYDQIVKHKPRSAKITSSQKNSISSTEIVGNFSTIAKKYKIPLVVTGFEPADLVQGIYHAVLQLENGEYFVENQYKRLVKSNGNLRAKEVIFDVFEIGEQEWRGIGKIPKSGFTMTEK